MATTGSVHGTGHPRGDQPRSAELRRIRKDRRQLNGARLVTRPDVWWRRLNQRRRPYARRCRPPRAQLGRASRSAAATTAPVTGAGRERAGRADVLRLALRCTASTDTGPAGPTRRHHLQPCRRRATIPFGPANAFKASTSPCTTAACTKGTLVFAMTSAAARPAGRELRLHRRTAEHIASGTTVARRAGVSRRAPAGAPRPPVGRPGPLSPAAHRGRPGRSPPRPAPLQGRTRACPAPRWRRPNAAPPRRRPRHPRRRRTGSDTAVHGRARGAEGGPDVGELQEWQRVGQPGHRRTVSASTRDNLTEEPGASHRRHQCRRLAKCLAHDGRELDHIEEPSPMSETLENLLNETRLFPPPAEFAAAANVTQGAMPRPGEDRLAFWEQAGPPAALGQGVGPDAGLDQPAVREVVRGWPAQRGVQLPRPARRSRPRRQGRHPLGGRARRHPHHHVCRPAPRWCARPPTR